jgi:branched-chain amino acid transport system substrate-binding protein
MMRLFTTIVACCFCLSAAAKPPADISIGGIFDLSGGGAIWGIDERNAFLLAVKDFEARNSGIKVDAIVEDSQFSSKHTVTALQKLISVSKVKYVVGATWETTVPMMPICEARKVVCISPSYHGKEYYTHPGRYSFTAWFDDRGYSTTIADEINGRGLRDVVVFAAITPYYDSLVDNLSQRLRAKPVRVERMGLEERDFRSMIVKASKSVGAIVMLLDNAGQIQAFLKQWAELRPDRPPVFSDDLIVFLDPPDDIKRYGFEFRYSFPVFDEAEMKEFVSRYEQEFKAKPHASSASVSYDETTLVLECAKRDPASEAVRNCVANTAGYKGASGTFSFGGGQTVTGRSMAIKGL